VALRQNIFEFDVPFTYPSCRASKNKAMTSAFASDLCAVNIFALKERFALTSNYEKLLVLAP